MIFHPFNMAPPGEGADFPGRGSGRCSALIVIGCRLYFVGGSNQ